MPVIDYEQNLTYFEPKSYKGFVSLGVLGLLLLFGAIDEGLVRSAGSSQDAQQSQNARRLVITIGVGLLILAGVLILRHATRGPRDEYIDGQVSALMQEMTQRALWKLGLDPAEVSLIAPIVIGGYFIGSLGTASLAKRGKDKFIRTSNFEGVVIFFSEQELHAYKHQTSLIAKETAERTDVYFYRDVVSISTNSSSRALSIVGSRMTVPWTTEVFSLTTSGGTAVECSMNATNAQTARAIQGARQLVRNKKLHTQ